MTAALNPVQTALEITQQLKAALLFQQKLGLKWVEVSTQPPLQSQTQHQNRSVGEAHAQHVENRSTGSVQAASNHQNQKPVQTRTEDPVFAFEGPKSPVVFVFDSRKKLLTEAWTQETVALFQKILTAIDLKLPEVSLMHLDCLGKPFSTEHREFLKSQVAERGGKCMIALGEMCSSSLLGVQRSVEKLRGKWYGPPGGLRLRVTHHPAEVVKNNELKRPIWEDIKDLKSELDVSAT